MSKQTELAQVADTITVDSGNIGFGGVTSPQAGFGVSGCIDTNGAYFARGQIASHQTNAVVLQYGNNLAELRAYGATAGSGQIRFMTGGGGGSADTERMRVDASGRVTMPYQPYFAAEMNNTGAYINTAQQTALPFNTLVHNIGNHFNTSTYRFTAPITGKYLMAVGVINNQSNPIGRIMFYLNNNSDGGNMKWGINGSGTAGGGSHTATSIIYMSAGDYVDVRSQSGNINNYQDNHSSWTGILLG